MHQVLPPPPTIHEYAPDSWGWFLRFSYLALLGIFEEINTSSGRFDLKFFFFQSMDTHDALCDVEQRAFIENMWRNCRSFIVKRKHRIRSYGSDIWPPPPSMGADTTPPPCIRPWHTGNIQQHLQQCQAPWAYRSVAKRNKTSQIINTL